MSTISFSVICVLCLIFLSTLNVVVGRHINVIDREKPQVFTSQDISESLETLIQEQTRDSPSHLNGTLSNESDNTTMKAKKMSKNIHKNAREFRQIMNHRGGKKLPNNPKHIKSKLPKFATWRIPRKKKGVPETSFNLDYAPPKVHPPSHN